MNATMKMFSETNVKDANALALKAHRLTFTPEDSENRDKNELIREIDNTLSELSKRFAWVFLRAHDFESIIKNQTIEPAILSLARNTRLTVSSIINNK